MSLSNEERIFIILLQRLNKYHIPRLLILKDKVENGEQLNQWELDFLEQVFKSTHEILPKVIGNPKYAGIFMKAIHLYTEITELALKNT